MPRTRPQYPPEFRVRMVELVHAGRSAESLAREFEPTAQTIRNWVKQAEYDEGLRGDGLTSAEREELQRLRRENKRQAEELEILGKATAWFALRKDESQRRRRRHFLPRKQERRHRQGPSGPPAHRAVVWFIPV